MKEKEGGTHKTLSKKIGKWNMVQCKKFWKQHWQNVLVNIKEYLTGEDEQKKVYFILIVLPVMRERSQTKFGHSSPLRWSWEDILGCEVEAP